MPGQLKFRGQRHGGLITKNKKDFKEGHEIDQRRRNCPENTLLRVSTSPKNDGKDGGSKDIFPLGM